jgi:type I restriction enzyme S subunit
MAKFKLKLPPLHVQEKIVKKLDKFFESLNKIKERQNAIELKRSVLTGSAVDDIFEKLSKNKADKLSNLSLRVTQGPNPKYMGESDKGYFVLKTKDFYNDVVLYENCTGLSKKLFEEFKNFELFDDDIIIGLVGVGSIGKINIFKQQSGKKYIFTRATGLIRTSKKLNPHYLLAFFNSKKGKKFIEQGISGTTGQLVIKTSYLKNLVIPCPEQKTQEKIANEATKIYMLNKNIDEELQQIQTKLNLLPKAVLTKAFSGAL